MLGFKSHPRVVEGASGSHAPRTDLPLVGKVAIITGAARNLGRGCAEMLAKNGADVVVHHHSDRAAQEAKDTAEIVSAHGRRALVVSGDVSRVREVERLFAETADAFGRVDILINAAGVVIKKPFVEITEADFDRSFGVNAKAAFFCMKEAAKRIEDGGRIINIGTTLLGATTGYYSVYAGSKAPLEDFTRALAKEIGHRGVTVNTIAPGPLDTSFFYPAETDESVAFLRSMSVQNRLGRIEEIVPVIEFLVSPGAGWVTAQTLFVNGGFVAR